MSMKKPDRVDRVSPLKELWAEFHDNKGWAIAILVISLILSVITSSFIGLLISRAGHIIMPKWFNNYDINAVSIFIFGIYKTWWLSIILFIIFLGLSFKVYRSLRRTFRKNYDDNYLQSKTESFGGAHWQTSEEMDKYFNKYECIEDAYEDVLGIDEHGYLRALKDIPGLPIFKLYIGAPGSGKSAAIILTSIFQNIRAGLSMIVTDSKGDLYRYTSAVARKAGYKVRVLNLKPGELKNSDGFDLFHSLNPESDTLDVDAEVITDIIFKNTTGLKEIEDYWYKNEFNLVKMAIMVIATGASYRAANTNHLPEVFNFLSTNTPDTLRTRMELYKTTNPEIFKCYQIFANCEVRNQGQIINGAAMRLQKLGNKVFNHSLSVNEIDTVAPMKEKCIYYVIIPDQNKTYRFISSLFFTQIFNDQCNYFDNLPLAEQEKSKPVVYLLDEYKTTGGIANLPDAIASIRSRKIQLTIILQDMSQLDSMYGEEDAKTIKNCCTIKGLLSTNDTDTAKAFSELLGSETIITESNRYYEGAGDIIHARPTVQKTMGENQRSLLLPEEFMNGKLTRDEIVYIISGMPPVRLRKYFSELGKKANHFLYQLALDDAAVNGERIPSRHKPKWRHDLEEEAKKLKERADNDANLASENVTASSSTPQENSESNDAPKGTPLSDILAGYNRQ